MKKNIKIVVIGIIDLGGKNIDGVIIHFNYSGKCIKNKYFWFKKCMQDACVPSNSSKTS